MKGRFGPSFIDKEDAASVLPGNQRAGSSSVPCLPTLSEESRALFIHTLLYKYSHYHKRLPSSWGQSSNTAARGERRQRPCVPSAPGGADLGKRPGWRRAHVAGASQTGPGCEVCGLSCRLHQQEESWGCVSPTLPPEGSVSSNTKIPPLHPAQTLIHLSAHPWGWRKMLAFQTRYPWISALACAYLWCENVPCQGGGKKNKNKTDHRPWWPFPPEQAACPPDLTTLPRATFPHAPAQNYTVDARHLKQIILNVAFCIVRSTCMIFESLPNLCFSHPLPLVPQSLLKLFFFLVNFFCTWGNHFNWLTERVKLFLIWTLPARPVHPFWVLSCLLYESSNIATSPGLRSGYRSFA